MPRWCYSLGSCCAPKGKARVFLELACGTIGDAYRQLIAGDRHVGIRGNYRISVNHHLGHIGGFCDVAYVDFPLPRPFAFSETFKNCEFN